MPTYKPPYLFMMTLSDYKRIVNWIQIKADEADTVDDLEKEILRAIRRDAGYGLKGDAKFNQYKKGIMHWFDTQGKLYDDLIESLPRTYASTLIPLLDSSPISLWNKYQKVPLNKRTKFKDSFSHQVPQSQINSHISDLKEEYQDIDTLFPKPAQRYQRAGFKSAISREITSLTKLSSKVY